jgi:hypothetical protein
MARSTSTPPNLYSIVVRSTPSRTNNLVNTPEDPPISGTPSTPSYCPSTSPIVDGKVARCIEILNYYFKILPSWSKPSTWVAHH